MNMKKLLFIMVFLLFFSSLTLQAATTMDIKLRFFEGIRVGKPDPPQFVTSSYLQSTVTATIRSKFLLAEEREQIKKVFNLKEVSLITEFDMRWKSERGKIAKIFRLDSREYAVVLTPFSKEVLISKKKSIQGKYQFKIEIFEQGDEFKNSLLDTEIILPGNNIAVFGFEDKNGTPYFLSFHVAGMESVPSPPEPPSPPSPPAPPSQQKDRAEEIREFEEGAYKVEGEVKPPKLVKKVNPVYPEEARKAKVEGVVILGARIDKEGQVSRVIVQKGMDPLLNQAAVDAVKQWKYEPMIIKGKSVEALFTVTVRFALKGKEIAVGEVEPPKLINKVNPVYPEEARRSHIQGVVLLGVRIDEVGNVVNVEVLKSESSLLNKPAVDAVKQWKYEPFYSKGKPVPIDFVVTVSFRLR